MKRILFNATHAEELRLAIVDGQKLLDLDIESAHYHQKKGNIYKAKVTRVEPSLEAAFVDYGTERQGFLPLKEISRLYFKDFDDRTSMSQVRIKDVIKEGQELVVQVEKDERGTKGAALTTFISLAGRYLVLMPNNPRGGGISRRIEGEERAELREAISQLNIPRDYSVIARTAGIGRGTEELQWDLDYLVALWDAISKAETDRHAPFLIYQESNLVVRAVRDYMRPDIGEILVDSQEIFERMQKFALQVAPQSADRLKLYQDETPLFSRYQIETQIETAFSREVRLPSGGAIVFDKTEALVTVDVNSSRATKGADIEETALNTNLEAAEELARQLRLRDLGGLIVIDFIDMTPERNRRDVENLLQESLKMDRARVQVGRISRFGLLEMSRQRLRPALGETSSLVCPRCRGTGHIRNVPSVALYVLRLIQEQAMKENTAAVHVHLPVETATYLLNEKRHEVSQIESRLGTPILVVASTEMETPHYHIRRLRLEEFETEADTLSYEIDIVDEEENEAEKPTLAADKVETPVIGSFTHTAAAPPPRPQAPKASGPGFWSRLFTKLFGGKTEKKPEVKPERRPEHRPRPQHQGRRHERHDRNDHRRGGHGQRHEQRGPAPGGQSPSQPHQPRPPRPQQQPSSPQPQAGGQGAGQGQPAANGGGARDDGSRRRRRRGRGRGGRPLEGGRGEPRQGDPNTPDRPIPDDIGNRMPNTPPPAERVEHDDHQPPATPAPAAPRAEVSPPSREEAPATVQVETQPEKTNS
ncbi:MAG: Rne/Rng family ribonuclease [Pseudomonadota bacterium]